MKRLFALLLLASLGACAEGDIPVPDSGPGRQQAICAISLSQWLGINSHEVEVTGVAASGPNASVRMRARDPRVSATCEISPDYALVSMVVD